MLAAFMPTVPFYYMTLETYYLGKLKQPAFSGPDDVSLAIIAVSFYVGFYGNEFFLNEYDFFGIFGNIRLSHICMYLIAIFELTSNFNSVY